MLKILSSVVLSIALSVGAMSVLPEQIKKYDYQTLRQATWRLDLQNAFESGSCSGTFIKPQIMLTAAHCDIGGTFSVGGVKAVMVKKDVEKDLMLLYVPMYSGTVKVAVDAPAVDEKVVIAGYPFGVAQYITEGRIQIGLEIPEEMGPQPDYTAVSAMVVGGNSGGGAYVKVGLGYRLVGVVSKGGGTVTLVVSLKEIKEFLK